MYSIAQNIISLCGRLNKLHKKKFFYVVFRKKKIYSYFVPKFLCFRWICIKKYIFCSLWFLISCFFFRSLKLCRNSYFYPKSHKLGLEWGCIRGGFHFLRFCGFFTSLFCVELNLFCLQITNFQKETALIDQIKIIEILLWHF